MNDSESFQEVINDLLEVKEDILKNKKEIKDAQKPKDVFEDKGIFE